MSLEAYKKAILETCQTVPPLPLEEAPVPDFDLGVAPVCPGCGGLNSVDSVSEDGDPYHTCHDCFAVFTQRAPSVSAGLVRKLGASHRRRTLELSRFETLSSIPPSGVDPTDYAAFVKAVDDIGDARSRRLGGASQPPSGVVPTNYAAFKKKKAVVPL